MTRETLLQLKLGALDPGYFRAKFGVEIVDEFREAWETLASQGMLRIEDQRVVLTRTGLLQVDRLLPALYDQKYRNARYT